MIVVHCPLVVWINATNSANASLLLKHGIHLLRRDAVCACPVLPARTLLAPSLQAVHMLGRTFVEVRHFLPHTTPKTVFTSLPISVRCPNRALGGGVADRKSTRLNSSHVAIS